jgi:hypothetical protein
MDDPVCTYLLRSSKPRIMPKQPRKKIEREKKNKKKKKGGRGITKEQRKLNMSKLGSKLGPRCLFFPFLYLAGHEALPLRLPLTPRTGFMTKTGFPSAASQETPSMYNSRRLLAK